MLFVCFLIIITVSFCDSTSNCTAPNTLITFDDLPAPGHVGVLIPANYSNLTWSNVYYVTPDNATSSGYHTALSSGQNVAHNGFGNMMSITSLPTNRSFSITSFIASSAWKDNLQLDIVAQHSGTTVHNGSIILQVTSALLVTLNWQNFDTIFFTTSGGTQHPMFTLTGTQFVMDNLCINIAPFSGGSGSGSGSDEFEMPDTKPDGPTIPVGGIVGIVIAVVVIVVVIVLCIHSIASGRC